MSWSLKRKITGPDKPEKSISGVSVGEVIPVAVKGNVMGLSVKGKAKRNYIPAEVCWTISDSDILSVRSLFRHLVNNN